MSWPVSDDYRRAIKRSHRIVTRVEVLRNGSTEALLRVEAGSVTVDAGQSVRRTLEIPLLDRTGALVPGVPEDLLHVVGSELRAWRGIHFGDDRPGIPDGIAPRGCELVPLITGPLYENDADDQGAGIRLSLQAYDRSRYVVDAGWDGHYQPAAGTLWTTAIMDAVLDRLPTPLRADLVATINSDDTNTVPKGVAAGNNSETDPMATCIRWATDNGLDLAFDPLGAPVLREMPDPIYDQPVATYRDADQELFSVRKRLSRETVYNRVIVTGSSPGGGAPVRAVVSDDDPTSPTYVDGPMGPKPYAYSSELIRTNGQATRAGAKILARVRGIGEQIEFGTNVDGSLDVYDVVGLQRTTMKIDSRYALEAFPVPLDPETSGTFAVRHRRTN